MSMWISKMKTKKDAEQVLAHIGIYTDLFGRTREEAYALYQENKGDGGIAVEICAPTELTENLQQEFLTSCIPILQDWCKTVSAATVISAVIEKRERRDCLHALIASNVEGRMSTRHMKNRENEFLLCRALWDLSKTYGVDFI